MAVSKVDFLDHPELIEEAQKINAISMNPSRTTTGPAAWTNPRTSAAYSVASGGELALAKKIRNDNISAFGVQDIAAKVEARGQQDQLPPRLGILFLIPRLESPSGITAPRGLMRRGRRYD